MYSLICFDIAYIFYSQNDRNRAEELEEIFTNSSEFESSLIQHDILFEYEV